MKNSVLFALLLSLTACRKAPVYGPSEGEVRTERLGKLRNEIAALTSPRGCKAVAECQLVGIGYNRCGGPRQHIVYCGKGADESALKAKLDELEKLEEDEAKHQGEPPPCKKIAEPQIEITDGACRAKL